MTPAEALAAAAEAGVLLEARNGELAYRGTAAPVSPALKEALRQHKASVIAILEAEPWRGDPAEASTGLWSDDDPAPLAEDWPYGFAPELPDDDEHARWLAGGRSEASRHDHEDSGAAGEGRANGRSAETRGDPGRGHKKISHDENSFLAEARDHERNTRTRG